MIEAADGIGTVACLGWSPWSDHIPKTCSAPIFPFPPQIPACSSERTPFLISLMPRWEYRCPTRSRSWPEALYKCLGRLFSSRHLILVIFSCTFPPVWELGLRSVSTAPYSDPQDSCPESPRACHRPFFVVAWQRKKLLWFFCQKSSALFPYAQTSLTDLLCSVLSRTNNSDHFTCFQIWRSGFRDPLSAMPPWFTAFQTAPSAVHLIICVSPDSQQRGLSVES